MVVSVRGVDYPWGPSSRSPTARLACGKRTLAATIKARWICEQAHQQLKEELGLDHFEGRSWQGLLRHALMTMIAYAFLQHRRPRGIYHTAISGDTKPSTNARGYREVPL